jgi:hypothetical protein
LDKFYQITTKRLQELFSKKNLDLITPYIAAAASKHAAAASQAQQQLASVQQQLARASQ